MTDLPNEHALFERAAAIVARVTAAGGTRADAVGEVVRDLEVSPLHAGRLIAGYPARTAVKALWELRLYYDVADLRQWEAMTRRPPPAALDALAGCYRLPRVKLGGLPR